MKENILFKLDLLEAFYLQKPARFGVTKQMLRSEKYQTQKSMNSLNASSTRAEKQRHKLLQLSRDDAFKMIEELQHEAFDKKLHFIETSLLRAIKNCLKKEKLRITQKIQTEKDEEKLSNLNSLLKTINELLSNENIKILEDNIKHKIFKILISKYPNHFDIKNNKFEGVSQSVINYFQNMKENNPYKTNSKNINNLLSKTYSDKNVKSTIDSIDSFEIIWGPKKYSKNDDETMEIYDENKENDISHSDSNDEEFENDNENKNEKTIDNNLKDEDFEKLYDDYKDYIAGSSDEEEVEDKYELDPNINYNEITDEEPSEEDEEEDEEDEELDDKKEKESKRSLEDDDFFTTEPQNKKSKLSLKDAQIPKLATGYYSGGESEDEVKDDLVDELTKTRKNRRGQRARQKIWEKKYGTNAKHVVKQHERTKSERERLRIEFEERQARREQRQKIREEREKLKAEKLQKQQDKGMHPSWEAKLKAQESMKKAKFAGKKITFD